MKPIINYKEHCKVRIRNVDKSFHHHEIVKMFIALLSARKHKEAGIYTEHELVNRDIVDVMIDLGKDQVYYEIQKELSPKWLQAVRDRDLSLSINTIVVPLKKLSTDILILRKQLEEYVV